MAKRFKEIKKIGIKDPFGVNPNFGVQWNREQTQEVCSYSHNGINQYKNFGNVLNSVLSGANPQFTLEFWLKRGTLAATQRILSKWSGQGNQRGFFVYFNGSNELVFTKSNNGSATQGNTSDNAFTNNSDYIYIAITYDGTVGDYNNAVKMYINGILEPNTATTATMLPIYASSENLVFGTAKSGAGTLTNFFDGEDRQIVISSDVKSAAYILSRYNLGNMSEPSATNLEGYWNYKTDEFSNPDWTIYDLSTNGNNGVSVNMDESNRTCGNI